MVGGPSTSTEAIAVLVVASDSVSVALMTAPGPLGSETVQPQVVSAVAGALHPALPPTETATLLSADLVPLTVTEFRGTNCPGVGVSIVTLGSTASGDWVGVGDGDCAAWTAAGPAVRSEANRTIAARARAPRTPSRGLLPQTGRADGFDELSGTVIQSNEDARPRRAR